MTQDEKDVHDAVLAYYEGYDEMIRLLKAGGSAEATPVMKRTMTGEYLEFGVSVVEPGQVVAKGSAQIDGYSVGAQTETRIPIRGCENQSKLRFFDAKTGEEKKLDVTGLLVRDVVAVKGSDGQWRIAKITGNHFVEREDWEQQSCMVTTERPA